MAVRGIRDEIGHFEGVTRAIAWKAIRCEQILAALPYAEKLKAFLQLATKAQVSLVVLLSPFLVVAMSGLFIPIQIRATADASDTAPSSALKVLFLVVTFSQKCATFLLAHCIGRLVLAVGH